MDIVSLNFLVGIFGQEIVYFLCQRLKCKGFIVHGTLIFTGKTYSAADHKSLLLRYQLFDPKTLKLLISFHKFYIASAFLILGDI